MANPLINSGDAVLVVYQSTLIADADGTTVVRSRMSTHFEQEAMLRHCTILTDIKVIADVIEATLSARK